MGAQRTKSGPFDGKVTRFCTSLVLPVDGARTGECKGCGACIAVCPNDALSLGRQTPAAPQGTTG